MSDCVLAVDIGGTKLSVALVNSSGQILHVLKAPVERGGPAALAAQVRQQAHELAAAADIPFRNLLAAGAVVPGIYLAATGNVWVPNLWGHAQVPFRAELQKALELPIAIGSDRAGYVLGEQWTGAAQGRSDVVFLAVGTGIGAGILSGGHLLRGVGDIAGAVGWFALQPNYRDIYREMGCWEAEAAGTGPGSALGYCVL